MDLEIYLALAFIASATFFVLHFREWADRRANSVYSQGIKRLFATRRAAALSEYIVVIVVNTL